MRQPHPRLPLVTVLPSGPRGPDELDSEAFMIHCHKPTTIIGCQAGTSAAPSGRTAVVFFIMAPPSRCLFQHLPGMSKYVHKSPARPGTKLAARSESIACGNLPGKTDKEVHLTVEESWPKWSLDEVYDLSQRRTTSQRLFSGGVSAQQTNPLVEEVSAFLARIEVQLQRIHEQR